MYTWSEVAIFKLASGEEKGKEGRDTIRQLGGEWKKKQHRKSWCLQDKNKTKQKSEDIQTPPKKIIKETDFAAAIEEVSNELRIS